MMPQPRTRTPRDQAKREQAAAQHAELCALRPLVPILQARPKRRTAMYLRISLDSNLLGEGIDRQHFECWERAEEEMLDVTALFVDNDTSASTDEFRPGFEDMKARIKAGEFDRIICWSQDRLLRKPRQMEDLITIAEFRPLAIHVATGSAADLTTAEGRIAARNKASQAAFETERKTERQKARTRQVARKGTTPVAEIYGYDIHRERDANGKPVGPPRAVINPDEAKIVREVFELYVSGVGVTDILRMMNGRGLVNTWGNPWTRKTIITMLRNPRYIGERWVQTRQKTEDGKRVLVMTQVFDAAGNPVMGEWEPIFTGDEVDSLFREAGRRMERRVEQTWTGHNGTSRKWIGTGLYECGVCGGTLTARYGVKRVGKYLAYMCYPKYHVTRDGADVDFFVQQAVLTYLSRFGVAELLADKAGADESAALKEAEAKIARKLGRVESDYDDEILTAVEYRAKKDTLLTNLEAIRGQIAALAQTSVLSMLNGSADPAAAFLGAPLGVQQSILRELCTVTVNKGKRGKRPADWRQRPGHRMSDGVHIAWRSGREMDLTEFDIPA